MSLVIGFDKSLRQGNTMYPYIIFEFKIKKTFQAEIKLPEENLKEIHPELKKSYEGPYYEVVAKLFKKIIGINIIVPGNFKTTAGQSGVRCNVGNQGGFLHLLNKSLIFIKKPVIYIRTSDITRVEFHRVTGGVNMRGFDFEIILKSGVSTPFSGAEKKELENMMAYFEKNGIFVKTIDEMTAIDQELGINPDDDDIKIKDEESEDDEDEVLDDDFVAPDDLDEGDDDFEA